MKMKAAVVYEQGLPTPYAESRAVKVEEVDLEGPGDTEILVKIAAAGVCHSDLSVVNGNRARPVPVVIGHEGAGVVQEVGKLVNDVAVGDHVAFIFMPNCGECIQCRQGKPSNCEQGNAANAAGRLLSGNKRISMNGSEINHYAGVSCFAEYVTADHRSVVKLPKEIPLDVAAVFSCAVITGVGAVVNTAKVPMGASVGVVGLGGVGLSAMLGAKASGARQIVGIDPVQYKRDGAKQLGADLVFDPNDPDIVSKIKDATGGGLEYVFEAVGEVEAMELAYAVTGRGGTTTSSGLSHPSKNFSVSHVQLVSEERTIKGSFLGSCVPKRDIPNFIRMFQDGKLPVDQLIKGDIDLEDINEAFDKLEHGETVRQIIKF
ncbi:MAG: alcohol dehydrogenase catalytic domain-containing protein [Rhodospirillales bacterium]|nr:alcohol dehydrogenase catalytic domain-containing protein [Rhodospirillales bacterium]MBO6788303.1 alcohol dehydrogenase catalytic domain-containing protein [Rhodospirillales bacterium]